MLHQPSRQKPQYTRSRVSTGCKNTTRAVTLSPAGQSASGARTKQSMKQHSTAPEPRVMASDVSRCAAMAGCLTVSSTSCAACAGLMQSHSPSLARMRNCSAPACQALRSTGSSTARLDGLHLRRAKKGVLHLWLCQDAHSLQVVVSYGPAYKERQAELIAYPSRQQLSQATHTASSAQLQAHLVTCSPWVPMRHTPCTQAALPPAASTRARSCSSAAVCGRLNSLACPFSNSTAPQSPAQLWCQAGHRP